MPNFKEIALSDRDEYDSILRRCNLRSSDYNFNNMYLWSRPFGLTADVISGCLVLRFRYQGETFFSYPVGGDSEAALAVLLSYCRDNSVKPRIGCLTEEMADTLQKLYPDRFTLVHERAYDDYLYTVEKLADLSGKKMHAKRNYINRFMQDYPDWTFEIITAETMSECRRMNDEWFELNQSEHHMNYDDETRALDLMFTHYDHMGLEGGLLRAGGKVVAFTVGEKLCSDTWNTHFEKAYSHIPGAYAIINREYASYIRETHPEIRYINREDDMGLENPRKAKESYYPDLMINKYTAIFNEL